MKEFKERLIISRWYSQLTADNYIRTMLLLDRYLKDISLNKRGVEESEEISLNDIEWFSRIERLKWKSINTVNNYLSWIKIYLKFCYIKWKNVIDQKKILLIRCPRSKIEALTDEEAWRLFNYFKTVKCKNDNQELIKTRNLLICDLLLYTWLRVNELSNIKIIDLKEEMQIIGKWWVRRVVYFFPEDFRLINLYLSLRKDNNEYLLVNHSHNYKTKKLSNVSIENIIREWWKKIWIEVFPHKLRHTFATSLLRKWVNLPSIQRLLWHQNLTTTQTYLTVLNRELKEAQMILR